MSDEGIDPPKLPAICREMRLCLSEGVGVVNSRDVAEVFEKRHDHVLRDIDTILTAPNLGASDWFRPVEYLDAKGEARRSFNLTKQGFTLLVMGWTGERAMLFKVKFITAFDAMEEALRMGIAARPDYMLELRESVVDLKVSIDQRFDYQDRQMALMREEAKAIAEAALKRTIISKIVKIEHYEAIFRSGGMCPSCRIVQIIVDAKFSAIVEFDHWYAKYRSSTNEVWPICKDCHSELTEERVPRDDRRIEFDAFHRMRRRIRRQSELF